MENKHLNNLEYKQSMLEKSLSDMCPHQSQSCEIVGDYIMKKIASGDCYVGNDKIIIENVDRTIFQAYCCLNTRQLIGTINMIRQKIVKSEQFMDVKHPFFFKRKVLEIVVENIRDTTCQCRLIFGDDDGNVI